MKRDLITIGDGIVAIPDNPRMSDFEIGELFGVSTSKVRANIRSLLKSRICSDDFSNGGVVYGKTIYPLYYGIEMIIALSFRIDSINARIFRDWVAKQITPKESRQTIFITLPLSQIYN